MLDFSKKVVGEALTYDDVLLIPAYSEVLPREVEIRSELTREISINAPLISAAMDTVTEWNLAIAIAREGGIGMLHKNMSIERQAEQVRKVKRSESGMIVDPITLRENASAERALQIMRENKIGGIPITNAEGKLIGIITNRDLRFVKSLSTAVAELMSKENLITAREGIGLKEAEVILQQHRIEKLPVVDEEYNLVGLITYRDILKAVDYPNSCKDNLGRLRVGAAIGVTRDMLQRVEALAGAGVDVVSLDTAHGHSRGVLHSLKEIKDSFPTLQVILGNVASGAAARQAVEFGADGVKVGVGPGSICTTRVIAGVGVPQLTAVMECSQALQGTGVPLIADGGIRYTGDLVKAIAAGADTVMAGSLFAGVDESPGETIIYEGRKFKSYRGMGSIEAMKEGSKDRYFQDAEDEIKKLVPEGIVGRVPYKGRLSEVMYQYIGGLKAGMGYCGAKDIASLKKAQFTRITNAGIRESHPHGVMITKEAPNYSR